MLIKLPQEKGYLAAAMVIRIWREGQQVNIETLGGGAFHTRCIVLKYPDTQIAELERSSLTLEWLHALKAGREPAPYPAQTYGGMDDGNGAGS